MSGSIALVTGAAAGTGRAIARRLAAAGAQVIVADVAPDGEGVAREIGARYVQADVTSDDDVRRMIAFAGDLQILVNNAGGIRYAEPYFPDVRPADWQYTLDLNLRGPMLATQLALAPMQRGGAGAVVNIAFTAGLGLAAYVSPEYGAAKAGLIRFTSTLAGLHERMNVRVNCIVPDWIATAPALAELERMTPAERAAAPVPRPPEEIADVAIDLIEDDALARRAVVLWPEQPPRLLPREG